MRSVRNLVLALAGVASLSCFPGRFDDLEKTTWVQFAEKDSDQVNGDLGIDAIGIDLPSGTTQGGAFVASSAGAGGITQVVFDETGGISSRIGKAGTKAASGDLTPLNDTPIYTLAPFVVGTATTGFIAAQPFHDVDSSGASTHGVAVHFNTGITSAGVVGPNPGATEYGDAVLVGDFGSGAATPDIIVISLFEIRVIAADGSQRACGLKRPNFPTGFAMGFKNAALAKVRGGGTENQLIISGKILDDTPMVMIYDAADITDAAECPTKGFAVGNPGQEPPMTVAAGDFDNDSKLDLVTGTNLNPSAATAATVKLYSDIGGNQTGSQGVALSAAAANPSTFFGSRILIDNVDGAAGNELVIGDPDGSANGTSGAGKVYIFKATTSAAPSLLTTLFDPDPSANEHFGRALATTTFKGKTTTKVLGVGGRDKLWVYFRVDTAATDPRAL